MERHRVVVAGFTSRVAQLITASLLEQGGIRGDRKSLKEIAGVLEHTYGSKFTLENLGTIQDLHEKMISARAAFPDDVGKWLGLHYNYFTINGSTLLRGYDNDRYPDVQIESLETFCRRHSLDQLPTLFR